MRGGFDRRPVAIIIDPTADQVRVSRAEVVWEGKIDRPFIGHASQDWDKCLLVATRAASTSSR